MAKKRTAYIVAHTHWDREWRYPLWETQLMLIDFMDELIDVLESGKYAGFVLDGQVVPVLDYLKLKPEMTEPIKALVKSGKLQIGPWLLLPDEYPVDGEAMVRNLLWGNRKAKELGCVFNVGYTSFGWGQTAQLPQIYAGFGIDIAMVGKQISKARAPESEFLWRSPDGSELLATRYGKTGRANFYFKLHLTALFGIDYEGPNWAYDWSNGGIAYHSADADQAEQDHQRLDAPTKWHPEAITPELIEKLWASTDESVIDEHRLMMNGCDYTNPQPMVTEMIERINEVDPDPDRKWVQATMPQFIKLMKKSIDQTKLKVVKGELRDGPAGSLTGNAITTSLYLKRLNKKAQNLLIRFAEPMSVLAAAAGASYPNALIEKAWEYLLYSHPHDSINGVSQDKTSRDVFHRLDQVIDLSQSLGNRAMKELIKRIDLAEFNDDDVLVVVFNSLPYPRSQVVDANINMPDEKPRNQNWVAYSPPGGIQMFDAKGKAVGTQWQGSTDETYCVAEMHTRAFPFNCERHQISFNTGKIPAGGYKVFRAAYAKDSNVKGIARNDSVSRTDTLLKSPNVIENEFLSIEMNHNGTFDMTDRTIGTNFNSLNYYEDRGEHGDYWVNKRPMFDQVHTSLGCNARIYSEQSGPLQATLVSEITMSLPKRGDKANQKRSDELADLKIKTSVTLRAGQKFAEVNVEFENRHEDHYLRAMFPTRLSKATHADAGGHFIVDHRPIRPQGPDTETIWPDMATQPQNNFIDVSDGKTGIAFLNDSLGEYEVLDNDERTVALSLLRSVKNWICTETRVGSSFPSQKGGQSLGSHSIRYALQPHAGNWLQGDIALAAEFFNVAPRVVQTRKHKGQLPGTENSLFSVHNDTLRFSTLKKTEDRKTFIIRLYNPTAQTQKAMIKLAPKITAAWQTDLNEKRMNKLNPAKAGYVSVTAEPYKIITIEIKLK
ncbi:alpha-mannosidase [Planctomycetota bacterium]